MNRTGKYTAWGNPDPERQTPHALSYLWTLLQIFRPEYKTLSNHGGWESQKEE